MRCNKSELGSIPWNEHFQRLRQKELNGALQTLLRNGCQYRMQFLLRPKAILAVAPLSVSDSLLLMNLP